MVNWLHAAPATGAAFLASIVEAVEALTVVLAVGSIRGWRDTLAGAAAAAAVLLVICAVFGPALTLIPLHLVQVVVGGLLLLFGLRWLRKAILRSARILPLHDEDAAFAKIQAEMVPGARARFDAVAFAAAFKITMLEGVEVVFIVIAVAAGGPGLLIPASLGALAAVLIVVGLGFIVHRPLSRVPENTLKFIVGILLCAFGTFWVGEGIGIAWPFTDGAIFGLTIGYGALALGTAAAARPIMED